MYLEVNFIKLWLEADDIGITAIHFVTEPKSSSRHLSPLAKKHLLLAKAELISYFNGTLIEFTVPLHFLTGTSFQQKVWQTLTTISYGKIKTYQEIAVLANSPKAQQAVGQANRHNPIPIIVPCHRVIGKNGKLVGYLGNSPEDLKIKQFLLDLEQKKEL